MFSNYVKTQLQVTCHLAESDLTKQIPVCDDLLDSCHVAIPESSVGDSQTRPVEFVYKGSPKVYLD